MFKRLYLEDHQLFLSGKFVQRRCDHRDRSFYMNANEIATISMDWTDVGAVCRSERHLVRIISNLDRCRDETGSNFPGFGLHRSLGLELGSDSGLVRLG